MAFGCVRPYNNITDGAQRHPAESTATVAVALTYFSQFPLLDARVTMSNNLNREK